MDNGGVRSTLARLLSASRVLGSRGPQTAQKQPFSQQWPAHILLFIFSTMVTANKFHDILFFVFLNVKKNANRLVSSYKLFMWSLASHLNTTFIHFKNIFKLSISEFINHNQWNWKKIDIILDLKIFKIKVWKQNNYLKS